MITRGIKYYNIADLKKQVYKTVDAKKVENAIIDGELNLASDQYLSSLVTTETTKGLNLFLGDLMIQFIPKEAVHLYFQYREFKRIADNQLTSTEELRDRVAELEAKLIDYEADPMFTNSFAIIYQLGHDGSKQLDSVGTCLPIKVTGILTDERVYTVDDDLPVFSDDGIPEGIYYYKDGNGQIRYTKNVDRGRQIGT